MKSVLAATVDNGDLIPKKGRQLTDHTNQSPCKLHQQGRPTKSEARKVGLLKVSPCSNCISKGLTKTTLSTALPRAKKQEVKQERARI